jgi:hypothetical protein
MEIVGTDACAKNEGKHKVHLLLEGTESNRKL